MKSLVFIILTIFTLQATAQRTSTTCDSIRWTDSRKLTWNDFKSPANNNNPFAAMTYESIYYNYTWSKNTLNLQTRAFFVPCLSWTKHPESDNLLLHEQSHFDIAELFRRLFIKSVVDANLSSTTVKSDISAIYNNIYDKKHEFHSKYDNETDYSRSKEKQAQWTKKVHRLLEDLKDYEKETVTLTVN